MGATACISEAEQHRREKGEVIGRAQTRVAALLRDPSSAQFSDVQVRGAEICGAVNGKNALGGYGSPRRFVVAAGVVNFDPSESPVSTDMAQVRVSERCLFDVQYRVCRGELGPSNPMERCLTGERMIPLGQAITAAVAENACLRALEKRFNEDVRVGQLVPISAKTTKSTSAWGVSVKWSASGADFVGISSTGTCVVRNDGRVLVKSLSTD